jgi:hypothetical protein
MSAAPQRLLPQLQGMMGESEKAAAELAAKQATTRKTEMEGDASYWQNQRNLASLPHTQKSWSAWRETLPEWSREYVPEEFTPASQQQVMRDSAAAIAEFNRQNLTAEQQSMETDRAEQRGISRGQLAVSQRNAAVNEAAERRQAASGAALSPAEAARQRVLGETQAKFQTALPQATQDATQAISLIDEMIGNAKYDPKTKRVTYGNVPPHPGFSGAVGFGVGTRFIPGTAAASFQALFDQVQGGAFLQAFETLRGGGAITEKEGAKATAAKNRMSLAQSEDEFVKAAIEFQDVLRTGIKNAQAKAGGAASAVAPAAAGPRKTPSGVTYTVED